MLRLALSTLLSMAPAPAPVDAPAAPEAAPAEVQTLTGPAYADELEVLPPEQQDQKGAMKLFESGYQAYAEGRYDEALEFMASAYRLYPSPGLLYSLGQTHKELYQATGDERHQRYAILRYGQLLSVDASHERAASAQREMGLLLAARQLGTVDERKPTTRVMVSTDAEDAWMSIDGGEKRPAPGVISVEPGDHQVEVGGEGRQVSIERITVPSGATVQVELTPAYLPAELVLEGPAGARAYVDGREVGQFPLDRPIVLEPGTHSVQVIRNGHQTFARQFELDPGDSLAYEASTPISSQRKLSYGLMAGGALGVAASGITTGLAFAAQSRAKSLDESFDNEGNGTPEEYATYLDEIRRRDDLRTVGVAAGVVGGAMLATGVILYVFDEPRLEGAGLGATSRRSERSPALRVAPVLSRREVGLSAGLRF